MSFEDCISTAIDSVLAWNIPDEDHLAARINDQACLMACISPDEIEVDQADIH
jgi:hypothetical protein